MGIQRRFFAPGTQITAEHLNELWAELQRLGQVSIEGMDLCSTPAGLAWRQTARPGAVVALEITGAGLGRGPYPVAVYEAAFAADGAYSGSLAGRRLVDQAEAFAVDAVALDEVLPTRRRYLGFRVNDHYEFWAGVL
jgi:hypothetical protein